MRVKGELGQGSHHIDEKLRGDVECSRMFVVAWRDECANQEKLRKRERSSASF